MNDRTQKALDGELGPDDLTSGELTEVEESRTLISNVLRAIPAQELPALGQSVLQRIAADEAAMESSHHAATSATQSSGVISWLWSPKRLSIPLRPAYVLGLAAAAALVVGVSLTGNPRDEPAPVVASAAAVAPQQVLVHFRLEAPQASAVALAGDFSNWAPDIAMKLTEPGVWTIVVPLEPGVHDYSFIIDGEKWVPDPAAPARDDGFGGKNSRIAVLSPDARAL